MIGSTISHYKILEKLGEGGMGIVYKAQDTDLNRIVALKFLPSQSKLSEQDNERFLREAQTAAVLNHPNVCTIYSIERETIDGEQRQFIVMEYMEGMTLREKLAEGPLPLDLASQFAVQIGEALQEAHGKNIVHRDIKADNVMVTGKNKIKVMDFGLAKLKGSLKLTKTSSTVGTLAYMAPEQIQGGEVDSRSDIFSFGVLFYEMLTGKMPYRGEHQAAMVYSIVNEPAEPITKYLPDASAELQNIFAKALEKDPEERYQTAIDMVVDIRRLKKQTSKITSVRSLMQDSSAAQTYASSSAIVQSQEEKKNIWSSAFVWQIACGIALLGLAGVILFGPRNATPFHMTVTQVTDLSGQEMQPDISPDGNYVVFVKGPAELTDIYLQRIGGGNPIDLTQGSRTVNLYPSFSPKGDMIAFQSERGGGGIFLMGSTGESVRRLTHEGYNPSWSPDGSAIVYSTEGADTPFSRTTVSQLWVVSVADGSAKKIYDGDAIQPAWSPHGYRIAFWGLPRGTGQRDLWTINADGTDPVRITNDEAIDWIPKWSSDGKYLYFLSDRGGTMNVWRIAINEQSGTTSGQPEEATVPASDCSWLTLSNDGNHILYSSLDRTANIFKSGFDPVAGKIVRPEVQITTGSKTYFWMDISPDGKWIATSRSGVQEDLYVMKSDGSDIRRLTNDKAKDRGPKWFPDGKSILFYSNRAGTYMAWKIGIDGSGLEQLTTTYINNPIVFDNGRRIASFGDGTTVLIDLAKPIQERTYNTLPQIPSGPFFFVTDASPDGTLLLGTGQFPDGSNNELYIYSIRDSSYKKILDYGYDPIWIDGTNKILFFSKGKLALLNRRDNSIKILDDSIFWTNGSMLALTSDQRSLYYIKSEKESDIWQATIQ